MINLIGGDLYQWDTGRLAVITTENNMAIHEVHFTNSSMDSAYVVNTYEHEGALFCAIPNVILQVAREIICYEMTRTDSGEMTVSETKFPVNKRNKPQDYVYLESEILNYETLANTALTDQELSALIDELNGGE